MTPLRALKDRVGEAKHFRNFARYHRRHADVYSLFCRFTRQVIRAGHQHIGAHLILQRLRWETAINPERYQGFKISNCHFPFYARLFMLQYAEHMGFFRTKSLKRANGTLIDEDN